MATTAHSLLVTLEASVAAAAANTATAKRLVAAAVARSNTPFSQQGDALAMVFTATAAWLEAWVADDPPSALVDDWDVEEWIEADVAPALQVALLDTLDQPASRADALVIARALLYEYYRFRRALQLAAVRREPLDVRVNRLLALLARPQSVQKSREWLAEKVELTSASEMGVVVAADHNSATYGALVELKALPLSIALELGLVRETQRTVFLADDAGRLPARVWGWRYEPCLRQLYAMSLGAAHDGTPATVRDDAGRLRSLTTPRLGASPDGLVLSGPRAGRLLELKAPLSRRLTAAIPAGYIAQMQTQADVCDVPAVDYLEVRVAPWPAAVVTAALAAIAGTDHAAAAAAAAALSPMPAAAPLTPGLPRVVGTVLVVAPAPDAPPETWEYAYSPLFPRDAPAGWAAALAWLPASDSGVHPCVLERTLWTPEEWHADTVLRNPRWWATVAAPRHAAFWQRVMALRSDPVALNAVIARLRERAVARLAAAGGVAGAAAFVDDEDVAAITGPCTATPVIGTKRSGDDDNDGGRCSGKRARFVDDEDDEM